MIFEKLCSAALLLIILLESGAAFAGVSELTLKGAADKPYIISINKLKVPSSDVLTIKPYGADMGELRNELELYRKFYLFFALFQGYVLIKAATR